MTTPARRTRKNASAVAAAQQSQTQDITVTLSAPMVADLEYLADPSGDGRNQPTAGEVIEAILFRHRAMFQCRANAWKIRRSDIVSRKARNWFDSWRRGDEIAKSCRRENEQDRSPAPDQPADSADMDRHREKLELESSICQALGLIDLLSNSLVAEREAAGGRLVGAETSGYVALAVNTGKRLHAAFYGRAA